MSYNGSGTFSINTSGQPVVNGTTIDPTVFNSLTADLATGLSTAICKDGQTVVTANIPLGTYKITGLGAATARTDAASLANIQDGTGVYVGTVGGTADVITLTASPAITAYAAGQTFRFIASGANTTNVTVNISSLGAKAVTKNGTTALVAGDIPSGMMATITYDGTRFILSTIGGSLIGTVSTAVSDISTLQTNSLSKALADAKGDLLVGTAADTIARKAAGTNGYILTADSAQSDGLNWVAPASAVSTMHSILNASFTVTMAANAVTIALKTAAGADASATDPISITFRHGTATNGTYVVRTVTGALSTVISSGSTGGTLNGAVSRIYVGVLDNAGTVELCWWNPVNTTGLFGFAETELLSTTAEGGAGAADAAHVVYSTTARASVYVRYFGYFESTQVTAGTWAAAADKLQLIGPGVPRTGTLIQRKQLFDGAVATGTSTIPVDDTIPQNTEGDQYMSLAITPTHAVNLLTIMVTAYCSSSSNSYGIAGLFQDSTANALASAVWYNALPSGTHFRYLMSAGTTSATTFKVRIGPYSSGTITFNGLSSARLFGGTLPSMIWIEEVCA